MDEIIIEESGSVEVVEINSGWQGPIGYTGSAGIQGEKGQDGAQGPIGYTGSAGNIGYTGSQGPIGLTGYTGSQGISGTAGPTGYTGSQGPIGLTGYTGSKGDTGLQGITGYTGSAGYTGSQGPIGYTGSAGSQGSIGYTGSQGSIGYTGSQGPIGYTGSAGIDGLPGVQGPIGPAGYAGSQGEQGPIGYTGSAGIDGLPGVQGPIGYTGSQGIQGIQGEQGPIGYTGSQGQMPSIIDHLSFDTGTTFISTGSGDIYWDGDATFNMSLLNGVTLQVGQETHFYGKAIEPISNGQVVMFAGAQGDHFLFKKADATSVGFHPRYVIGVATQDFISNQFGYVTCFGKVNDLNTSVYAEGTVLFLDTAVPGGLTTNVNGTYKIPVAAVINQHASHGTIFVRPDFVASVNDLHDTAINSPVANQVLSYNGTRWENKSLINDSTSTTATVYSSSYVAGQLGDISSALAAILGV